MVPYMIKISTKVVEDSHIKLEELVKKVKIYQPITVITNHDIVTNYNVNGYEPDILKIVNHFQNKEGLNPHLDNPIYLKKTEAEEKANL